MQVYDTSMMTSEMHSLISSGVETHNFQSRNMFLGNSEGEMSNRSPVMATSYQGLENNNPWKSMNVQESRSNTAWAAPNIVIPSNIQGIASYGVQNMANSLLFTGGVSSRSEASATASMMEIHPTNGLTFDTQKSFVEGSFNIPSLIQTVSSEVSPSVRDSTRSQWQSSGSGSGSGSDGNMQQHNQLVLSHLNNTLNWGNGRSGSQQWSSRDPFLQNISAGQDRSGQGLSLSLSFHHPSEMHLQDLDNQANVLQMDGDIKAKPEDLFRGTTGANSIPYSISSSYPRDGMCAEKGIMNTLQGRPLIMHINGGSAQGAFASHASSLKNSVYLRAAQELLDEFCNVGVGNTKTNNSPKRKPSSMSGNFVPDKLPYGTRNSDFAAKSEGGMNREMYSGDRFELQRRKAKLVSMLEEVDRRYKHYRNQMQAIINSFESVTTIGGAAPYTSLALKAMSRHFRCLRDVISSQLQMTSKSLGENDSVVPGTTRGETPRLGFLERSIRQQRALQQLGMMEQHPWRPQRGLPERSVSVLRAWLFEHFLHPYPTDADKHILARQTGLTRSQVSNWFINARVRLWKPMVEEMYLEEAKEEKVDSAAKVGAQDAQEKEKEKGERSAGTNSTDDQKSAFKSGGGSDSQCTASEEEAVATAAFKLQDHSCTMVSQTAKAEIFDTMKLHNTVPSSQDDIKDLDMALIRESETLSAMNASQGGMKFDQAPSYKKFEDHDKGLYINKLQVTHDTDMTLDFSSYNMTTPNTMAAYSQEELTTRHFANSGVSLTLGLHHSGGLSFPMSEDKYDNNMYFPRDDPCSNQYTMLENDGSQANGFIEPDLQFRNYVSGGRLLHDFVG